MQTLVDNYLAVWNETDATRRAALIAALFTPDARYVDPLASVAGRDQLLGLVGAVQARFPGHVFTQRGGVDHHNAFARFSWALGPTAGTPVAAGTDIATLDGDRIANVTGFLDDLPPAARRTAITTRDGAQLFFTDTGGPGMPVVLVASAMLPGAMWKYQTPALRAAGLRCITFDRRGHGRSSPAFHGFDIDTLADDLDAVITTLDLRDAMLVGHSFGNAEIVRYLSKHGTARVSRVALIAATTPSAGRTLTDSAPVHALWATNFPKWVADNRDAFFATPDKPELLDWIASEILAIQPEVAILVDHVVASIDLQADCRAIDKPTLVIHGTADASTPLDCGKRTAAAIRGARLSIYDGAAHGLFLTHAERLNAELIAFSASRGS